VPVRVSGGVVLVRVLGGGLVLVRVLGGGLVLVRVLGGRLVLVLVSNDAELFGRKVHCCLRVTLSASWRTSI
jgi:hypothetical protein